MFCAICQKVQLDPMSNSVCCDTCIQANLNLYYRLGDVGTVKRTLSEALVYMRTIVEAGYPEAALVADLVPLIEERLPAIVKSAAQLRAADTENDVKIKAGWVARDAARK